MLNRHVVSGINPTEFVQFAAVSVNDSIRALDRFDRNIPCLRQIQPATLMGKNNQLSKSSVTNPLTVTFVGGFWYMGQI